MGIGAIILIVLLIGGIYYIYTNDLLKMSTVTNPIDQFLVKNNTPGSTITKVNDKTIFSFPWQYYNCAENGGGDNSCRSVYGPGTFCLINQSDINYGKCYANQ